MKAPLQYGYLLLFGSIVRFNRSVLRIRIFILISFLRSLSLGSLVVRVFLSAFTRPLQSLSSNSPFLRMFTSNSRTSILSLWFLSFNRILWRMSLLIRFNIKLFDLSHFVPFSVNFSYHSNSFSHISFYNSFLQRIFHLMSFLVSSIYLLDSVLERTFLLIAKVKFANIDVLREARNSRNLLIRLVRGHVSK